MISSRHFLDIFGWGTAPSYGLYLLIIKQNQREDTSKHRSIITPNVLVLFRSKFGRDQLPYTTVIKTPLYISISFPLPVIPT